MTNGIRGLFVLLLAATACAKQASSTAAPGEAAGPRSDAPRRDRNVILLDELSEPSIRAMNILDAIRSLRPTFFTVRGKASQSNDEAGKVHASLNYNGVISVNDLRNIPTVGVIEVRLLDVAASMNRFGGAANQGPVILVRTQ